MVNVELVKELRAKTFLGMSECASALFEANDDLEKAIEILKTRGLKKINTEILPLEGVVRALPNGILFELNCQTDQATRSEIFCNLLKTIESNMDQFRFESMDRLFSDEINTASAQLDELVVLRRVLTCRAAGVTNCAVYNHPGDKLAAVVLYRAEQQSDQINDLISNVAMHIVAQNPLYLTAKDIDPSQIRQKTEEYSKGLENKPEAIRQKILDGKLSKWYQEICLLDQEAIFAPKSSISEQLSKYDQLTIVNFKRIERGEV